MGIGSTQRTDLSLLGSSGPLTSPRRASIVALLSRCLVVLRVRHRREREDLTAAEAFGTSTDTGKGLMIRYRDLGKWSVEKTQTWPLPMPATGLGTTEANNSRKKSPAAGREQKATSGLAARRLSSLMSKKRHSSDRPNSLEAATPSPSESISQPRG